MYLKKVLQQISQLSAEVRRKPNLEKRNMDISQIWILHKGELAIHELIAPWPYPSGDDFFVDLNGLVCEKGRIAGGHFVHEDAEGPPIHGLVITLKS